MNFASQQEFTFISIVARAIISARLAAAENISIILCVAKLQRKRVCGVCVNQTNKKQFRCEEGLKPD